MMLKTFMCAAMIMCFLLVGCSSRNFIVYKDNTSFYVANDCLARERVLCKSGDVDRVLRDAGLSLDLQQKLKDSFCGTEKLLAKKQLEQLSSQQYAALKEAFIKNGYQINKIADT